MSMPNTVTFMEDCLDGGIGRVIVNLSNTMNRMEVKVDVLLKSMHGQYVEKLDSEVRVVKVPTYHRYTGIPHIVSYLWSTPTTALIVPSERLAAIALAARTCSLRKPKILGCVHNIDPDWLTRAVTPEYHKRLTRIRRYYSKCDEIVCVSDELRQRFLKETALPAEKVCTIYNPVITDDVYPLAEESVDHPWFQPDELPVILGVGRLEYNKDFGTLIRAVACVRKTQKCRLVILGEGSQRAELEHLIQELHLQADVALLGEVKNAYAFMRKAALFVLSSVHEGLGNVLVEALALGTPVVSTNCPYGPSEILENGRYGLLVPVSDVQALARAIEKQLWVSGRRGTVQEAVVRFTAKTSARQYLDVCNIHTL